MAGCPIRARFFARVGFHEVVFLFLLFNDPQVAEGGFQFGNLVVMYAIETSPVQADDSV